MPFKKILPKATDALYKLTILLPAYPSRITRRHEQPSVESWTFYTIWSLGMQGILGQAHIPLQDGRRERWATATLHSHQKLFSGYEKLIGSEQ